MSFIVQLFYKRRKFYDDDFDWDNYTSDSYERRLKGDVESRFRAQSGQGRLVFDAESGKVTSTGAPLHPNHALILEVNGQLSPASVREVGCGGGDHVADALELFPDIRITGGDRGARQLDFALSRHPALKGKIGLQDITMPFSRAWPKAELVYTQAVVMHIHTAVSHFVALANIVQSASKYVVLVENHQCHNLVRDIQNLFEGGHLAWDRLHIHHFTGSAGARAILLSRSMLDLPLLKSDIELREGVKPSIRRLRRADEDSDRASFGFPRK